MTPSASRPSAPPRQSGEPGHSSKPLNQAEERRRRLVAMLLENGYCTTTELATSLDVSEMTIRRDIAKLEDEGKLRSVHGGVTMLPAGELIGTEFAERAHTNTSLKRTLAHAAMQFLPDNGIIAIDAGTTTAELSLVLPDDRQFTVITHSLPVLNNLVASGNADVIALGGVFHPQSLSYSGPMTTRTIADLSFGTVFLGASGVNERGVFCGNDFDAVTKRSLIDVADEVVLVCDSSKFSTTAMARVCPLNTLDRVIVDTGLPDAMRRILEDSGVAVTLVDP